MDSWLLSFGMLGIFKFPKSMSRFSGLVLVAVIVKEVYFKVYFKTRSPRED